MYTYNEDQLGDGVSMNQRLMDVPNAPSTRAATVLEELRNAVCNGQFAPGERLHEVRLTEQLGASRTPVRAALQKLASEGLLDHAPNHGYRMREFPVAEIVYAFELRAVLEGLAARLAAERGLSSEHQRLLEQSLYDGDRLLSRGVLIEGDRAAYSTINTCFHQTVHAAAGSRMLQDMVRLCRQVPISSPRMIVEFEYRDVRRRHDDHQRVFEAILGREAWRAEMLMRDHVMYLKTAMIRSLPTRAAAIELRYSPEEASPE
ncbi:GntR family transcriptional regulator [Bradyrhizobium sp. dw_411]|uniref:GntR family transcriptional regulator n=1 Tax=Bradyrhizobium sp. dw_411 TaxID=2720082 RepID=UPI001BCBD39A|nr:GntR family transcriptional regulator [Bradyrhizobium sp. dw_411]